MKKRQASSCCSVVTCAVRRLKTESTIVAAIMKRLRPSRSANGPKLSAPSMAPNNAAENTAPRDSRGRCNAWAMAGAV